MREVRNSVAAKPINHPREHLKGLHTEPRLHWVDAFDRRLSLRGLAWLTETRKKKSFRRLPDHAEVGLSEGVRTLSQCPSGAFLSFLTDASDISLRMTYIEPKGQKHMPDSGSSGAELYMSEATRWLPIATAIPALPNRNFEGSLVTGLPKKIREFRLYLPLYNPLKSLTLGFSVGAKIQAAPASKSEKPIFIYGTSITQGACAATAGSDFVSILGRELGIDTINFGFSSSGRGEPEIAQLISEIDASMFVLDYAANCDSVRLRDTLPSFVKILRKKAPYVPIVLLGHIGFNKLLWSMDDRKEIDRKRDVMMAFYLSTKAAGDHHLYFIDGWGILPPGLNGSYVDGMHPTNAGFAMMAERLAPLLTLCRIADRDT